jgi:S-DNA-T family DNA segregation ATPase FtsK/SpoIIIE
MPRYRKKPGMFSRNKRPERRRYADEGVSGFSSIMEVIKNISPETRKGIFIIVIFLVAALSTLGLFDLSGRFGQFTDYILSIGLGNIKWLVPVLLGAWIFLLLNEEKYPIRFVNYFGTLLLILASAGLFHLPYDSWASLEVAKAGNGGGYLGSAVALPLIRLMSFWGALVVLVAGFLVGILLALETSIYGVMWPIKVIGWIAGKIKDWYYYRRMQRQERLLEESNTGYEEEEESTEVTELADGVESEAETEAETEEDENEPGFTRKEVKMSFSASEELVPQQPRAKKYGPIDIPVGLLNSKVGKATAGDIKNCQEVIRKTLNNFGIPVEMGDVNIGPTVTQYTMRPVDGVRLSKITTLNADMALALAAHPIRIEAPIPGKSLVGIEVPNVISAKVTMGEMLMSKEYKSRPNNLQIALGKDVSGKAIFAQLDKMPHLLVAGATGSGKSVCINSIIISLIYQNSPDELKFILVDPKRVELPGYNAIPYLLTPVITDVKKTIGSLKWAITEMERRFELLAKFGNRNIASYNQSHAEKIPYIVIIIDELADLMASAGADMEAGIVRLAQMSRAVGIHLILATQRPSTEVITGLIKANIPARISFSVASSIDSRTILDGSGAEKLVGRGDMLYLGPEYSKPKRIQGVFLSDKEINDVVKYIKSHGEVEYVEALSATSHSGSFGGGGFGGPQSTAQGYNLPVYEFDMSVRKDWTLTGGRTASLTFSVSDVFKTRVNKTYSESLYFIQNATRVRDQQFFRLNFSYRFGKFDVNLLRRKSSKGEEGGGGMDQMPQ